jgi:hypothetical protein
MRDIGTLATLLVPANVETCGHLGMPIMQSFCTLSGVASTRFLSFIRGSFLATVHCELSVALGQSQGSVYHSCALLLAKDSGRHVLPGVDTRFLD